MLAHGVQFFKAIRSKDLLFSGLPGVAIQPDPAYNPVGFILRCPCDT